MLSKARTSTIMRVLRIIIMMTSLRFPSARKSAWPFSGFTYLKPGVCAFAAVAVMAVLIGRSSAAALYVANGSFEAPSTVFVDTNILDWQKSPQPIWYNESANGPWAQLTGVFLNTPPDSTNNDHIVNCDG